MKAKVAAVILAAGKSTRTLAPKLLLPFDDSTVIQQTVHNVLDSEVDEVLVVLGFQGDRVARLLQGAPVRLVRNFDYEEGMLTSIVAGMNAASPHMEAVMIMPGDHPLIRSTTIDSLLTAYRGSGKGIAVPVYQGHRGHPAIFSLTYRNELLKLTREGAQQLLHSHPSDVLEVPVNSEEVLIDIDTFGDYRRARRVVDPKA
jgi:molybdenum cofactor cytidylyltransferase